MNGPVPPMIYTQVAKSRNFLIEALPVSGIISSQTHSIISLVFLISLKYSLKLLAAFRSNSRSSASILDLLGRGMVWVVKEHISCQPRQDITETKGLNQL